MKMSSRRQNVKIGTKTNTPHSIITAAASPKTSGVSKKSLSIQKKPEKLTSVQRTLVAVKNENGTKSVLVSNPNVKMSPRLRETNTPQKPTERTTRQKPTVQVESKKTVEVQPQKKLTVKKVGTDVHSPPTNQNEQQQQQINCKYCNLHFSSTIWLKKHISRNHTDKMNSIERPKNVIVVPKKTTQAPSTTKTMNISTYKKQIEEQKETIHRNATVISTTLAKQHSKTLKHKKKLSPTKTMLREQLKIQLEMQKKLLKVQQEIFEKANKAQNDIYDLLAKLGDENDDEEHEEIACSEVEEEQAIEDVETMFVKQEDSNACSTFKIQETEPLLSQTAYETIVPEEEYFVTEHYEVLDPLQNEDANCLYLNQELNTENVAQPALDQNVVVVVRSDEGDEEFELVEIEEDQFEGAIVNENNEFNLEIVGTDTDGVHCRIISDPFTEDVSFNEVKPSSPAKAPVKLEVGKISFKYKKESETETPEDKNESILNEKIKKTQNVSNDYIQKMVQSAVQTADNKYECPICKEVVSYKYSLGPHILRLHANSKKKICPHCDRGFTCTGDLTRHIRIHTGDKPFKCSFKNCSYAFRASGDLHKHLRRHNAANVNIRNHVCKVCDRAFERNYDLKRHSLTHKRNEEGVGYRCEFCSKHFLRKDQHKAHVYRHLGIKPFKCPDCDRCFGDFSNCSRHIKQCQAGDAHISDVINENILLFICDICQKRFKSKVGIQQHIVKCAKLTKEQKELQKQVKFEEE